MALERPKLNVLSLAAVCPAICIMIWRPELINRTGIDVAVHCWGTGTLSDLKTFFALSAPEMTTEEAWATCDPFGGNMILKDRYDRHRADATQGYLGGMDI
eukprot:448861-Rhodomonas_salina.2